MATVQAELRTIPEETSPCLHRALESLGSAGNATYRRCLNCRGVIVSFSGRLWLLPPSKRREGARDSPGGAEEGRERNTQRREVKAVFPTYAILAGVVLAIRAIVHWALF